MHWSTLLVLSASVAAPQLTVGPIQFDSYTKAYHAAADVHKPMLVIINPGTEEVSSTEPITLANLQADAAVGPLLDKYVVAIVDAGTEHGREVHKRFQSPSLPFAAVIDERQEKQLYRSDAPCCVADLQCVVEEYSEGTPVQRVTLKQPPADCPLCRKRWANF
ncbi:MAG: hypothetical protein KDA75_03085 [Planctomycetaceae bacterium]|nr:hypothetical protein [Planctomycetaceae bacterium]